MPSLTVENYLKAILQITTQEESETVSTGKLAQAMRVSPGTVTSMLKALSDSGLAEYKPYSGVTLTESGRLLALRMLRRHRLIELFLVKTLGLSWDLVHEEAENMEHAVSDFLIDRIDEFLGFPPTDPHGDPIPSADGDMRADTLSAVPLSQCNAETSIRFVRVTNQDPDFLRYLTDEGVSVGKLATINENNAKAGVIHFELEEHAVTMGHSAASHLLVESVS
ncbi:MAG: DtxR family iron (metal) dependent repressor [Planctomycetaceae bacterium]|nr:DtxR family iron (metal) dependent repressor [Planctomycetaceae bacterium]